MNSLRVDHPFDVDRLDSASDFVSDWDVPLVGKDVSDALRADVEATRRSPAPGSLRKIRVILGASGHGKTHLIGRVLHEQRGQVQFVYAPMVVYPAEPSRPVQWCLVESLFDSAKQPNAPLVQWLATLLRHSFIAFIDHLPTGARSRLTALRQQLETDPIAARPFFAGVAEIGPYHQLADSVLSRFPALPAAVVRALILGLSPAADAARMWLRGEAEQMPVERLRELKLPPEAPDATEVFKAVAGLLQQVKVPLVVCLDQTERLLEHSGKAFRDLTAALMGWLQEVPNLVLVLGCIEEVWKQGPEREGYQAFIGRCQSYYLQRLTPDQTVALLIRRLASWKGLPQGVPVGWPFDLNSVRRLAETMPVQARGFLSLCRERFKAWDAEGGKGLISMGDPPRPRTIEELFVEEWGRRLEGTKTSRKEAKDYQEAELWQGVQEALAVALRGGCAPEGVRLDKITPQALRVAPKDARPSAQLDLGVGAERRSVVIAVSKKDGGGAFGAWYEALEASTGGHVVGAVVVWPQGKLTVGKTAKAYQRYSARLAQGTLRAFPLDEHSSAFDNLECLRRLIMDAENKDVMLEGRAFTADECRDLAAKTGILANLKLFKILFCNWDGIESLRAKASPSQAAPSLLSVAAPVPVSPAGKQTNPAPQPAAAKGPAAAPTSSQPSPSDATQWADAMLKLVVEKLRNRGQGVFPDGHEIGPTFARLRVKQGDDADFAKIKKQADNLKLQLALDRKPLIASQAGYISIDIQRPDRQTVSLDPLLRLPAAKLDGQPAFPLGVDVAGKTHWLNLADPGTCHLLVTGTTGSGKSEFLKALLAGLAARLAPDVLQFVLIDPKQVTFSFRPGSPYLPEPIVFETAEALPLIKKCCEEMERRYALLRARGLEHVGQLKGRDAAPRWVVVFDEFADLMSDRAAKKELEGHLSRLGSMARAAGIHLVLGTQRAEASVVTPLLRSNLPGRVSLQVASERDSKLVLDEPDGAFLLGKGDLLLKQGGGLVRLQSPFVSRAELEKYLRCH